MGRTSIDVLINLSIQWIHALEEHWFLACASMDCLNYQDFSKFSIIEVNRTTELHSFVYDNPPNFLQIDSKNTINFVIFIYINLFIYIMKFSLIFCKIISLLQCQMEQGSNFRIMYGKLSIEWLILNYIWFDLNYIWFKN